MDTEDSKGKLNAQILEEAAEWLVEFNSGEAEPEVRPKFDSWLRTSPEHVRAYLELLPIWEEGAVLPLPDDASPETFIALAKTTDNIVSLSAQSTARAQPEPARLITRSRRRRVAIAASITLIVVALGTLRWFQLAHDNTYVTQVGEQRSISLVDGSMIELNARSRVRVRFTKEQRSVDLIEGQALFHVAKDHSRPFVVTSDGTQVRAVGTEFDVYQKHGGTIVTVVEGRVAILRDALAASLESSEGSANGSSVPTLPAMDAVGSVVPGIVYLSAGEQLTVTPKVEKKTGHPNVIAATAWTQHRLVFDAATLGDVVEEFNRYNTRPLVLHDTALQNFPISAAFSSTDPASLVRFLQAQPGISVTTSSDEIGIAATR